MKNLKKKFQKIIHSKKTAIILSIVVFTPFVLFGGILIRDYLQKGTPVVGSRNDGQLEHQITKDQIKEIEEKVSDDMILSSKVVLKSSTLRVYAKVSNEVSKDVMKTLSETLLNSVTEVLPLDTYFHSTEENKQYDLEIHVYNDIEDMESDEFVYYQLIHSSVTDQISARFVSEAKDEKFKEEVLELEKERIEKKEKEKAEKEKEKSESEEEASGEE